MTRYSEDSPVVEYLRSFLKRSGKGTSLAAITGEEAAQRYEQVIFKLDDDGLTDVFGDVVPAVFEELSVSQRMELGQMLQDEAEKLVSPQRFTENGMKTPADFVNPRKLARVALDIETVKRGSLVDVFAKGQGQKKLVHEWANSPVAKKTLGGIAGRAARRVLPS